MIFILDQNVFLAKKTSIGECLVLFKNEESGLNHIVDEQFISENNKKDDQDNEGTNSEIYHNSSHDEFPKLSDNLKPDAAKNNAPMPNVVTHEELETSFKKNLAKGDDANHACEVYCSVV